MEKETPKGEEGDSLPSEGKVGKRGPEQAPEPIRGPTVPPNDPKTAKSGGKKVRSSTNEREPEPPQVWVTKGNRTPSTSKKMPIPLRAVVKEPRKEGRQNPKKQEEEIFHIQERLQEREMKEVRSSSGDLARASIEKPPEESVGSDPGGTQIVAKSYPPSTEEGPDPPEKDPVHSKRMGKGAPVSGYLLPTLAQTHSIEGRFGEIVVLFKGKPERIKADTMIMEGDQDPCA